MRTCLNVHTDNIYSIGSRNTATKQCLDRVDFGLVWAKYVQVWPAWNLYRGPDGFHDGCVEDPSIKDLILKQTSGFKEKGWF